MIEGMLFVFVVIVALVLAIYMLVPVFTFVGAVLMALFSVIVGVGKSIVDFFNNLYLRIKIGR